MLVAVFLDWITKTGAQLEIIKKDDTNDYRRTGVPQAPQLGLEDDGGSSCRG